MTSWSTPINMIGNVMDNIQSDPRAQKLMLGVGPAIDVMKNTPIDLFSNIPHFDSEVDNSVSANVRNGSS